jgi:hypothetical protein
MEDTKKIRSQDYKCESHCYIEYIGCVNADKDEPTCKTHHKYCLGECRF